MATSVEKSWPRLGRDNGRGRGAQMAVDNQRGRDRRRSAIVCSTNRRLLTDAPRLARPGFPNHDFQHCDGVVARAVLLCRLFPQPAHRVRLVRLFFSGMHG